MKKGFAYNKIFFANVGKPVREPLRTLEEMADEFGVTFAQLRTFMRERDAPSPVFKHNSKRTQSRNWYCPSEMRKWWNARVKA